MIVSGLTLLHPGSSVVGNLFTKVFEVKVGAKINSHGDNYDKLPPYVHTLTTQSEEVIPFNTTQHPKITNPHPELPFKYNPVYQNRDHKPVNHEIDKRFHEQLLIDTLVDPQKIENLSFVLQEKLKPKDTLQSLTSDNETTLSTTDDSLNNTVDYTCIEELLFDMVDEINVATLTSDSLNDKQLEISEPLIPIFEFTPIGEQNSLLEFCFEDAVL